MSQPLLTIENLSIDFVSDEQTTHAVKNISLHINRGEIVALVGESGSGKSVTSLSILQLLPRPPAKYANGKILFSENGDTEIDLLNTSSKSIQQIRGHKIAMIFQEPMTSLNPVISCGKQVMESLLVHKKLSSLNAKQQTIKWFEKVKLPEPSKMFDRYPHQLSGGQKQRISIARALITKPKVLLLDDCLSAVDTETEEKILSGLNESFKGRTGIIISHRISSLRSAGKILYLQNGEVTEYGTHEELMKLQKVINGSYCLAPI